MSYPTPFSGLFLNATLNDCCSLAYKTFHKAITLIRSIRSYFKQTMPINRTVMTILPEKAKKMAI
ncbi:hypothetical protein SACS_0327 [Parasaccharibacter apium]|uniref:Uncharacterized protein n=1 Tax=Parasaccharibacter apium TaxID=1510841 RepID=A0A7U7J014_9PROT|nr:hypothetical protein SACS_0327 [Parasaccharibacter apium]